MLLQLLARVFITGETLLAAVVLAEELAAKDRGWGIGILGALGSLGHGMAAIVFAFVDVLPFGWRSLYLVGVIPLLFLSYFRRRLPETTRFAQHRSERDDRRSGLEGLRPIANLVRQYPGRVAALGLTVLPFDFVAGSAYAFMPKTLQEVHGYSPAQVTTIFILGGTIGILGNIFAGVLGDRFGRRPVLGVSVLIFAFSITGFYNASGALLPLLWIASIFSVLAVGVLFKALGAELFPTSHRSTASGVRNVLSTLGSISGLWLEGVLYAKLGSHALAITAMTPALIIPPLIAFLLPETARIELEEISPERERSSR
jgi:MFS family permease